MKIHFWGTRGSLPASFNQDCLNNKLKSVLKESQKFLLNSDEAIDSFISNNKTGNLCKTFGTNTCCVQLESGLENTDTPEYIILDSGSGIRDLSSHLISKNLINKPSIFHIFMTHLHWDHIQGFPFFTPIYIPGNKIVIHGYHYEIERMFKRQMSSPAFPVPLEALRSEIVFDARTPCESFEICGFRVHAIQQNHPGISFGYRFEKDGKSFVYSTDCEHSSEIYNKDNPLIGFFQEADLLVFDSMYYYADAFINKANWGHASNFTAVKSASKAKAKHLVLFHHDPTKSDEDLEKFYQDTLIYSKLYWEEENLTEFFPKQISMACDGLSIEI